MDILLVQFLSFAAVVLFILSLNALCRGRKASEQKRDVRPGLFGWFGDEITFVGRVIEPKVTQMFPEGSKKVQNDLMAAALNDRFSVQDIRGLQGFTGIVFFILTVVVILVFTLQGAWALLGGIVLGLMGFYYPVVRLQGGAQRRKDLISKELPFAIDLLTVAMEAGQDFAAAVRHLVREVSGGPLRQEFAIMLRETDLGKSRIEAMRSMSARIQVDEFNAIVTSVVQSTELGASVATALKLQADEIRRTRFHKAERKAARAPSLMLIPVAIFILPSVFIIILTPVIMRMMHSVHSVR